MRINFNLKNDFKHICLSAILCVDMNMFVKMRLPCSSKNAEKRLCHADEQIFPKLKCSVTSNRVRGAVFDPVGSFGIDI